MSTATSTSDNDLVPDPAVHREFGITAMTSWRWDRSAEMIAMGWPPPIRIRKRKFRSRQALDLFKESLMKRAIAQRRSELSEITAA